MVLYIIVSAKTNCLKANPKFRVHSNDLQITHRSLKNIKFIKIFFTSKESYRSTVHVYMQLNLRSKEKCGIPRSDFHETPKIRSSLF